MSTNSMGKRKCWREWQLCGMCGVQEHPDEYCTRTRGIVAGKGYFYGSKR
jgi:hypothetical protein